MSLTEGVEGNARGIRVFYDLLVAGAAIELAGTVITYVYNRHVVFPQVVPPSTGLPSQALELGGSLLAFAFSPCLLFGALYVLGKKVRLDEDWKSPAVSLFAGGAIAGALTIFAISAVNWPDTLSEITQQFGSGWNLASWVLSVVEGGLFMTFIGLAAIYMASRRTGRMTSQSEGAASRDDDGGTLQSSDPSRTVQTRPEL